MFAPRPIHGRATLSYPMRILRLLENPVSDIISAFGLLV
jgi:hypothetical protein